MHMGNALKQAWTIQWRRSRGIAKHNIVGFTRELTAQDDGRYYLMVFNKDERHFGHDFRSSNAVEAKKGDVIRLVGDPQFGEDGRFVSSPFIELLVSDPDFREADKPMMRWTWWRFDQFGSSIVHYGTTFNAPEDGEYGLEVRVPGQDSRWSNRLNLLKRQQALVECFDPTPRIVGVLGGAAPGPLPEHRDPDERIAELLKSNNELRERAMAAEAEAKALIGLSKTFSTVIHDIDVERKRSRGALLALRVNIRMLLQTRQAEYRDAREGRTPVRSSTYALSSEITALEELLAESDKLWGKS